MTQLASEGVGVDNQSLARWVNLTAKAPLTFSRTSPVQRIQPSARLNPSDLDHLYGLNTKPRFLTKGVRVGLRE
jgi:hypothetical protein